VGTLIWVDRTVEVLTSLSESPHGAGITELSRRHRIPKSTLHRMLNSLRRHDFIVQDSLTRRYRLGPALIRLGQPYSVGEALRRASVPYLRRLAAETGCNAFLAVWSGGEPVVVATAEGRMAGPDLAIQPATRLPLHASAASRALLAFMPEAAARSLVLSSAPFEPLTDRTPTAPEDILNIVQETRRRGYAVSREEGRSGVSSVAAPVFGGSGRAIAALTAQGPSELFQEGGLERVIRAVTSAALRLAAEVDVSAYAPAYEPVPNVGTAQASDD
jgi:DNA-binding IclR family transcriptional regulator